jgi:hypothetical protein
MIYDQRLVKEDAESGTATLEAGLAFLNFAGGTVERQQPRRLSLIVIKLPAGRSMICSSIPCRDER